MHHMLLCSVAELLEEINVLFIAGMDSVGQK